MLDKVYSEYRQKMTKTIEVLESEFARIRTARANPAILDGVKVDYYGQPTPLKQVASISVPEPRQIVVQPWDRSAMVEIEKALQKAELGLTPKVEANLIRLPIPALTEERRRELVKLCAKLTEDSRVAVRNLRREANDAAKKLEKEKKITEDDSKTCTKKIQEMTDEFIKKLDELLKHKEAEVIEK
ncbi:ribosome recycling factor [candidate division WOR-3 bacterium]|uniref:Ribosome-recycling factor n=1 Tax=candidate division WOR-3 bacterium TaxID=2052148 RepID=A0A938BR18_UNCW3|nr:ribosome recycling factor [candidate division WOR-3 bacterium]